MLGAANANKLEQADCKRVSSFGVAWVVELIVSPRALIFNLKLAGSVVRCGDAFSMRNFFADQKRHARSIEACLSLTSSVCDFYYTEVTECCIQWLWSFIFRASGLLVAVVADFSNCKQISVSGGMGFCEQCGAKLSDSARFCPGEFITLQTLGSQVSSVISVLERMRHSSPCASSFGTSGGWRWQQRPGGRPR